MVGLTQKLLVVHVKNNNIYNIYNIIAYCKHAHTNSLNPYKKQIIVVGIMLLDYGLNDVPHYVVTLSFVCMFSPLFNIQRSLYNICTAALQENINTSPAKPNL